MEKPEAYEQMMTGAQPIMRAFLDHCIDYAGLFPPANLPMEQAVRNYATYLTGADGWALGRFVVPVSRLEEMCKTCAGAINGQNAPWQISALLGQEQNAEVEHVNRFNHEHRDVLHVDTIEGKISDAKTLRIIAEKSAGRYSVYCEVPTNDKLAELSEIILEFDLRAKIRTGGIKPDMFPPAEQIVQFIETCVREQLPFKATAGLHHPLRAIYPLTYGPDSPMGMMFGFLNMLTAVTFSQHGTDHDDLIAILTEESGESFQTNGQSLEWNGRSFTADDAKRMRELFIAFGSCSFLEPLDGLRALGLL